MKLLLENWRQYLNEELNFLPIEILQGEEEFDEEEGEEGVLVQNIPFESLSMITKQGEGVLSDIRRGELSMTDGLPVLFYNIDKKQLLVEDGNHRIFQKWLAGENGFDAYVYSGTWHDTLRHVYDGEEKFDWDEEYRK